MLNNKQLEEMLLKMASDIKEIKEAVKRQDADEHPDEMIELPGRNRKKHLFYVRNIIMLRGNRQYTDFYFVKNHEPETDTQCGSIGHWAKAKSLKNFLRAHHSRLVNPVHVLDYSSSSHFMELTDEHHFNVSKTCRKTVRNFFSKRKAVRKLSNKKAQLSNSNEQT